MSIRKKYRGWSTMGCFALLLAMLFLTGCPASAPAPLRIGTNTWLGYEPLYLARDLGLFTGGTVQPVRFGSNTESIAALSEKRLEAAALTLDEALSVAQFDPDLVIVLVNDFSQGADALLVRPEITKPGDLKGRRIGVESSAVGAYMLQRFLDKTHLTEKELRVVHLPIDKQEAAFAAGEISAVITFEPVKTHLLAGGARILFDSSEIPGEIIDVVVVRASYLRHHPKEVGILLDGWFRALEQLRKDPAGAAEKMQNGLGLKVEEIVQGYKGLRLPDRQENRALLLGGHSPLGATTERLQEVMLNSRLLYKKPALDQLFDQAELARIYEP